MKLSLKTCIKIATVVWLLTAIYGLIFNISYIDEAKYLIKGWLIVSGQVSYYQTPEFFYQHMPGSFLWYGLGQIISGPSLLAGRLQSLMIGLLVFWSSFILAKKIINSRTGQIALLILSLSPVTALYYSAAVPQSLAALIMVWGVIFLHDGLVKKRAYGLTLATAFFSLLVIVRENFVFTLGLYFLFLTITGLNVKQWLKQLLVALGILGLFFIPGYPQTLKVFTNFLGVSQWWPSTNSELRILSLYWKEDLQSINLQFRAIREFAIIFHAWILILIGLAAYYLKTGLAQLRMIGTNRQKFWQFLIVVTVFNFIIHSWAAFKLSPRAIVSYLAYIAPLVAVILAILIQKIKSKTISLLIIPAYLFLLILSPVGVRFARIFAIPTLNPDLKVINQSAAKLDSFTSQKKHIIWLSEPISLYVSGKVYYYPLINHINFYKPTNETAIVRKLGFWNQEMLDQWLDEAELVVVDKNKLLLLNETPQGQQLVNDLTQKLIKDFQMIDERDDIWPGELLFYKPKQAV